MEEESRDEECLHFLQFRTIVLAASGSNCGRIYIYKHRHKQFHTKLAPTRAQPAKHHGHI